MAKTQTGKAPAFNSVAPEPPLTAPKISIRTEQVPEEDAEDRKCCFCFVQKKVTVSLALPAAQRPAASPAAAGRSAAAVGAAGAVGAGAAGAAGGSGAEESPRAAEDRRRGELARGGGKPSSLERLRQRREERRRRRDERRRRRLGNDSSGAESGDDDGAPPSLNMVVPFDGDNAADDDDNDADSDADGGAAQRRAAREGRRRSREERQRRNDPGIFIPAPAGAPPASQDMGGPSGSSPSPGRHKVSTAPAGYKSENRPMSSSGRRGSTGAPTGLPPIGMPSNQPPPPPRQEPPLQIDDAENDLLIDEFDQRAAPARRRSLGDSSAAPPSSSSSQPRGVRRQRSLERPGSDDSRQRLDELLQNRARVESFLARPGGAEASGFTSLSKQPSDPSIRIGPVGGLDSTLRRPQEREPEHEQAPLDDTIDWGKNDKLVEILHEYGGERNRREAEASKAVESHSMNTTNQTLHLDSLQMESIKGSL